MRKMSALIASVLLLASCGGGGGGDSATLAATPTATTTSTGTSGGTTTTPSNSGSGSSTTTNPGPGTPPAPPPTTTPTTPAPGTTALTASVVQAPGDGPVLRGEQIIINGTNMQNVELLPATPGTYLPRYGIFALSVGNMQATLTLGSTSLVKGAMTPVRVAAFDVPPGGAGNELVVMTRNWVLADDLRDLPYRDPTQLVTWMDDEAGTTQVLQNNWPVVQAEIEAHVPPKVYDITAFDTIRLLFGKVGDSAIGVCKREHTFVACHEAFLTIAGWERSKPH